MKFVFNSLFLVHYWIFPMCMSLFVSLYGYLVQNSGKISSHWICVSWKVFSRLPFLLIEINIFCVYYNSYVFFSWILFVLLYYLLYSCYQYWRMSNNKKLKENMRKPTQKFILFFPIKQINQDKYESREPLSLREWKTLYHLYHSHYKFSAVVSGIKSTTSLICIVSITDGICQQLTKRMIRPKENS